MVRLSPPKEEYWPADVSAVGELPASIAREDFYAFRKIIRPRLMFAWWQRDVAKNLMSFYEDMVAGKRPAIVLHGTTAARQDRTGDGLHRVGGGQATRT